MTVCCVLSTTA